jgi:phytoene dehydrogenase-like protein
MGLLRKYSRINMEDFASRFQDPFLRRVFDALIGLPDFPVIGLIFLLSDLQRRNAGYPIGGSLQFARGIEKRFLDLGGEILYNARVEKILVEQGRAVGVRLADGSELHADTTISAADGYSTIFKMLEGKYVNEEIERNYRELPIFEPVVQASFGVNRDLSGEPHSLTRLLKEPITIAGQEQRAVSWRHYCYDPTLAPEGKSLVAALIPSTHAYWKALAEDSDERYEAEKQQAALQVLQALEAHYPGIGSDIEMTDVATPLTFERYTGNWQGSFEGWLITTENIGMMFSGKTLPRMLPGLADFHMIGQWVMPGGGLPSGSMTGRMVIQDLCKVDGKKFTTSIPA